MCVNRLLNEAEGSLLDDEHLLITLQTSKSTSQDIKEQLETAEETEQQIDAAREVIRLVFHSYHACVSWLSGSCFVVMMLVFYSHQACVSWSSCLCFRLVFHGRHACVS